MIHREHAVTVKRQAELVGISRGTVYCLPRAVSAADLALMRRTDELHLNKPFLGSRMGFVRLGPDHRQSAYDYDP